ncbi:RNA-splicing factor [Aspergillus brasiliensis]|uniref:RNA-splicing factor n=1 Tax=Aspergillus brasiliensis TaxID=319629 RepID=A0A9W5YWJ2_9EURO|nr:RNA-splicing factor [Aspergillus brasiliensis]GKZ50059.1 RNA-splicing factor [Aspergillus brasiliensis]
MSSNVGLSTPRGSGTSGYVQRNFAFMKPRNAGYGAPYPPVSGSNSSSSFSDPASKPFKQRQPDKQILEHDRRRAIEVKVMEERERLEEENERIEEEMKDKKKGGKGGDEKVKEEGEEEEGEGEEEKVLTEEEIDERCEALRARLVKEMEEAEREKERGGGAGAGAGAAGRRGRRAWDLPPKERRQFKSYQVHELAEAKIEESERLRKALGIKEEK